MKPVAGKFVDLETRDPIGRLSRFVGARASTDQTQIRIRLHVLFFLSVIAPLNDTLSFFCIVKLEGSCKSH